MPKRNPVAMKFPRFLPRQLVYLCIVACLSLFGNGVLPAGAEEPYKLFLEKLRNERLYDLALIYLSDLEDAPDISDEFKSVILLERGILLYSAASQMSPQNAQRPVKLDQAEGAIRAFLKKSGPHPRRGEAQLSLGNLLLTRAEEAKAKAGPDFKQDIPEAIKFFTEAHDLFQETVKELAGVLDQIKGARTDANDTGKVAYREQLRGEVRRSQLLAAAAIENRGRSRADASPDRNKDLELALGMYNDLYMKEKEIVGIRNYALFYRSGVQETLSKIEDAIDGYQRIADQEGVDSLRMLQTQAVTKLVELFASQGKFQIADDRAERWESQIRPDERQAAEVLALKLERYKTRIAWIKDLEKKDKDDRNASKLTRDTRELLRALMRISGPHQDEARKLLADLGAEPGAATKAVEVPKVKNFAEALEAATERVQRGEASLQEIAAIQEKTADPATSEQDKKAKEQQLADAKESARINFEQASQLLQTSLKLFSKKDDRAQLFEARQKLAFCLLKQQQPWEAIAIGEFLAMSNPGTENGLLAGTIALAAYGELFKTEDSAMRSQLIDQLKPFAEFLVTTWPNAEESATAAAALVQLALINKEWSKAESFLGMVPTTTVAGANVHREAATQFYGRYLEAKRASQGDTPELQAARKLALDSLTKAASAINKDALSGPEIETINALAKMHLADDQTASAAKLFDELNPLKVISEKPDSLTMRATMDTYSTALQVEVGKLKGDEVDANQVSQKLSELVGLLEKAAEKDATGPQLLGGIYVQLARDLKDAVTATKDPGKRKKLSEALIKVTSEAGKKATAFGTNYWAADTLLSVADELKGNAGAQQAYTEASAILVKMVSKGQAEPDWMQPKGIDGQVKLMLARSQRGMGEFEEAIATISSLIETSNTLQAQLEAAKTYQAWGEKDAKYFKTAIEGAKAGKNGANLIWGFSKIANVASKNPANSEQFYEARYQVANSRYKLALGQGQDKAKLLEQAVKDIQSTARLYPALGGPEMKAKFDALLKQIQ
jgi:uncharacterized protein YbjQ (UPF0145 family)